MALSTLLFYACATLAVFCSVRVVTARHIFHAALYLACTLALLAVVYLLTQAEFVAVVQVLVYVGAVIVLIIFAVMLTAQIGDAKVEQTNRLALPAALGAAAAFLALSRALQTAPWDKAAAAAAQKKDADVAEASVAESAHAVQRSIPFRGGTLAYTVTPGTLTIRNDDGAPTASIFYVAYTVKPAPGAPVLPYPVVPAMNFIMSSAMSSSRREPMAIPFSSVMAASASRSKKLLMIAERAAFALLASFSDGCRNRRNRARPRRVSVSK